MEQNLKAHTMDGRAPSIAASLMEQNLKAFTMDGRAASMAASFQPSLLPVASTAFSSFHVASTMPSRERFYVELKPNETTVVSWKKLLKEAQKASVSSFSEAPAGAHPALEARIAPEALQKDCLPPPPNRFNSVIEKIERLYKGAHSSEEDEILSDVPDDDKYDTSDSFIDDEELDEYFSVDKAKLKHTGFFINRGKLEGAGELSPLPDSGPRKRKRKDSKKANNETLAEALSKKLKSRVRMKAAARKLSSPRLTSEKSKPSIPPPYVSSKQSDENANTDEDLPKDGPQRMVLCKAREDSFSTGNNIAKTSKNVNVEKPIDALSLVDLRELSVVERVDAMYGHKTDMIVQSKVQAKDISREAPAVVSKSNFKGGDEVRERGIVKSLSHSAKDTSPGRAKGSIMEKAIQDLEGAVADLCPPYLNAAGELEKAFESGGKSRRLPRDVKQKLTKVARLAAKHGGVPSDLIERLMGILGHMMHIKTLKRNLRVMIGNALSARQEKEGMLKNIKGEVTEMVKSRVSSLLAQEAEQQEGSSDDFQAQPGTGHKGSMGSKYAWDQATEDRICDLYDQYTEDMDEYKGPRIRKLYGELVELWPEGWMDNIGIKYAIHRAKERRKKQTKFSIEDSRRKQKVSAAFSLHEAGATCVPTGAVTITQSQKPFDLASYDPHAQGRTIHDISEQHEYVKKHSKKMTSKNPSKVENAGRKLDPDLPLLKRVKKSEKDILDWQLVSQRDV